MPFRKVSQSYDYNFSDSIFPRPLKNLPILNEKLSAKSKNSRFQHYLNSSPFANNSRIKEILGLKDSNYSALSSSRHMKLSTNNFPGKKIKLSSWVLPHKKYSILPNIKLKSVDKSEEDSKLLVTESQEKVMVNRGSSISQSIGKSERKIILSKISNKSHELLNSSLPIKY